MNWADEKLILDDICCKRSEYTNLQSRTRYHCEVNLLAQYIPLICAEKELTDQVSYVKLTSKRIQLFREAGSSECKFNK
jgi:hypothetical protein